MMSRPLFKTGVKLLVLAMFVLGLFFVSKADAAGNRVMVVFDPASSPAERRGVVMGQGATVIRDMRIVPVIVISLPEQASDKAREAILQDAAVVGIEDDVVVEAYVKPEKPPKPPKDDDKPQPEQILPWGVDRIDAEMAWPYSVGSAVKVAIIDTGIDVDHPDLVDNIAGGINIILPRKLYDDDNGHGTHVAGIIAAVDNNMGVIGVSNQAKLYGVKALDRKGIGWLSDIIAGLEWSVNNGMDIVNMSLGTPSDSQILHDAVTAVYNAGIVQVAAAGNAGGPVGYPARYPETIAVSAVDDQDSIAYWSNYGPEVDLAAPGVDIVSTYKGGDYRALNGTSMAAPHVAGCAALVLENQPAYTPDQVLAVLAATADDIGLSVDEQGAGLVDAEEAVLVTE